MAFLFLAISYFARLVTLTKLLITASLPLSSTTLVNESLAMRFVLVNGCGLVMTKLKLLVAPGVRPVLVWPMTHLVDWPIMVP